MMKVKNLYYFWYTINPSYFQQEIVELPVPSRPVWPLTCPLPVPYLSLTRPLPVPYLSGLPRPNKWDGDRHYICFQPTTTHHH